MTTIQLDVLYRLALAERFTSPTAPRKYTSAQGHKAIKWLVGRQYIRHNGARYVLTDDGRDELESELDRERLTLLHRVQKRRPPVSDQRR